MEPQFDKVKFPLEHPIAERVVKDMDYILAQGWADKVGEEDLGHAHVCVYENLLGGRLAKYGFKRGELIHFFESEQQIRELIAEDLGHLQTILLYHTHELDDRQDDPNRNIKSLPNQNPEVIPTCYFGAWDRERQDFSAMLRRAENKAVTVYSRDINLAELLDVEFELNPNGVYTLANGNRVNISASGLVLPNGPKISPAFDYIIR